MGRAGVLSSRSSPVPVDAVPQISPWEPSVASSDGEDLITGAIEHTHHLDLRAESLRTAGAPEHRQGPLLRSGKRQSTDVNMTDNLAALGCGPKGFDPVDFVHVPQQLLPFTLVDADR